MDDPGRVPASGERVTVGLQGNHALGARFEDGSDLITPELERAIDGVARRFRGADGGVLDYGRFDIRCAPRRGRGPGRRCWSIRR